MTKEIVEIEIAAEDLPLFNQLVLEYGQGDPSKFLAFAIRKIAKDRIRERLATLQAEVREDMGGKVYSTKQTQVLINKYRRRQFPES